MSEEGRMRRTKGKKERERAGGREEGKRKKGRREGEVSMYACSHGVW